MDVCTCACVCILCLKWQAFSTALIREMFVVGANLENKQDFREISDLWNTHTHTHTHVQIGCLEVSFLNKISHTPNG